MAETKHTHKHDVAGIHAHPITKNLWVALFLNLSFTVIEFVGGLLTNSVAVLSDAVHDLGDTIAIGSALFFENYSQKSGDKSFSYGYRRFSLLSALINATILLAGSAFIITKAVPRLLEPEEIQTTGVLYIALLGVAINGLAVFRLKKSHGNVNQKVISLHLLEDALGWIAVLAGALVIQYTGWTIIDPILSVGIAGFILFNAIKMIKKVITVMLQAVPENIQMDDIIQVVKNLHAVKSLHDAHIWSLDGNYHILTLHVVIQQGNTDEELMAIKQEIKTILLKKGIEHPTIELELEDEECLQKDC